MDKTDKFENSLPGALDKSKAKLAEQAVRKFSVRLEPGKTSYDILHQLGSSNVLVQTRIAGNIREGGISILDEDTVRVSFGGPLHEPMDVVIIG